MRALGRRRLRRRAVGVCVFLVLMTLVSCTGGAGGQVATSSTPTTRSVTTAPSRPVTVLKDLPYKAGDGLTEYERERCKLDLYLPDGAKGFATVVWFYGGGLEGGDKGQRVNVAIATELARHGVACAAVNYRLSPKASYPAYLDDAAASVAWTLAHITEPGGDPGRVFVSGHSAGGYLTAAIGYDPKFLARYHVSTGRIAGLVPVSPQVFTHFTIRKERGVPNPRTTPVIDEDAPAYHARPDGPPTLILIGDDDWPSRLEECQYFVRLLKVLKHPDGELRVIAGRTHNSIADKAAEPDDPAMVAMLAFVRKHMGAASQPAR
jgi:acetyl esterase/lipase